MIAALLLATALVGIAALTLLALSSRTLAAFTAADGFRSAITWAGASWAVGFATCLAGLFVALVALIGVRGTELTVGAVVLASVVARIVAQRGHPAPHRLDRLAQLGLIAVATASFVAAARR